MDRMPSNSTQLYRISAPHYVAGLVVLNGFVCRAAPILQWAVGKRWSFCEDYFLGKRYKVEDLSSKEGA
jgi:hypothetical protein